MNYQWEIMEYCRVLADHRKPDGNRTFNQEQISNIIGKSEPWVKQTLDLYERLPQEAIKLLASGELSRVQALLMIDDHFIQSPDLKS